MQAVRLEQAPVEPLNLVISISSKRQGEADEEILVNLIYTF